MAILKEVSVDSLKMADRTLNKTKAPYLKANIKWRDFFRIISYEGVLKSSRLSPVPEQMTKIDILDVRNLNLKLRLHVFNIFLKYKIGTGNYSVFFFRLYII